MNGYDLSRNFCNWAFENPDKVKPIHYAIFYFSIEHCNRLGWKDKFGLPSQMVMEAIGVKNWRTYSAGLHELVEFGFIEMIEISKNQYSSNIIAIVKNTKAPTKALDKALSKHSTKHSQSTVSIVKQETINKEQLHGLVEYLNTHCKQVQGLSSPINNLDAERLLVEFDKHDLVDVFMSMENTKDLKKKYNSANLTVRSWIKTRQKNNSNFGQIKQQDKFKAAWQ
jgi:hypothetical protein